MRSGSLENSLKWIFEGETMKLVKKDLKRLVIYEWDIKTLEYLTELKKLGKIKSLDIV